MTSKPVKGIRIKDGKVEIRPVYHDESARIRAKKKPKTTYKRGKRI